MKDIKKLLVNFNEGTKDYVTAAVYNMSGSLNGVLPDIKKPNNVSDYTVEWKQGLYGYYENVACKQLGLENTQFIHL